MRIERTCSNYLEITYNFLNSKASQRSNGNTASLCDHTRATCKMARKNALPSQKLKKKVD